MRQRPLVRPQELKDLVTEHWRGFLGELSDDGSSLLEVLICITLLGLMSLWSVSHFHRQIAVHQLDALTQNFVQDAQLARQKSQQLQETVSMKPLTKGHQISWTNGWDIQLGSTISNSPFKSHINTSPVEVAEHLLKPTQQFTDMSAPGKARHISFTNGDPALLHHGGFVANRIIWQHSRYPSLIRHIILGPGGRWRICNPDEDKQECQ
jgi:type IV fimbrial biogenesis protein FimT